MIYQVMTVYDSKVKAFLVPFFVRTVAEAIRSFTEAVNDPAKQFGKYASDYDLYKLGIYDDVTGKFAGEVPEHVIGALQVIEDIAVPRKEQ